jgi:DNA polymerase-1
MMKNLLIVDFANTVIRSLAVHQELTSPHGEPTGGLFGFIGQIANKLTTFRPHHVLVCKDAPPYLRKQHYPDYKANRKKSGDSEKSDLFFAAMNVSFRQVNEALQFLDIPTWSIEGLEADDLIASFVINSTEEYDKICILSNDDDLFQLLEFDNVVLIKKNEEFGKAQFKELYPTIEPKDWVEVTALAGTHNGVAGIPRVGIKTAIKILNDEKKLAKVFDEHFNLIKRNVSLIELPYCRYLDSWYTLPTLTTPRINETQLIRLLDNYGIRYHTYFMEAFSRYSNRRI